MATFKTDLRRLAKRYGWTVTTRGKGANSHLLLVKDGYEPISCSHSAANWGAIHAIERDLKRREREGPLRNRNGEATA